MGRGLQFIVGIMVVTAQIALAQETATTSDGSNPAVSTGSLKKAIVQKEYEQDDKITDMEINAESGSLSRYSMQLYFGYAGPSINNLTDTSQPNPLGRPVPSQTDVSGTVGVRYRITSDDSLYLSTGIEGYFQPDGQKNPDLENPGLKYDHTYKIGPFQAYTGISAVQSTESYYTAKGEAAGSILSHTMKYYVPNSRWILGGQLEAEEWFYDRDWVKKDKQATDTEFLFNPSVEYRLTPSLNLNTSYSVGAVHYRGINAINTYTADLASIWLGVGYGITRDIYLKPYLSFYPQALSLNNTAVALTTYINVF